jgi:hypothetical protein
MTLRKVPTLHHQNQIIVVKTLNFYQTIQIKFITIKSNYAMKNLVKTIVLCLFANVAFSQAKHSFDEMTFSKDDKIVKVTVSSQGITNQEGFFIYSASVTVDVPNEKISNVILKSYGKIISIALNKVTYIPNIYIPNLGSYGEGYSYKGTGTNVIFYFFKGDSKFGDTFKVMFYVPVGPQDIGIGN